MSKKQSTPTDDEPWRERKTEFYKAKCIRPISAATSLIQSVDTIV